MPVVQLEGVTVGFGGVPVLDGVDLVVEKGERLCLLGRNGAGKSTLLRVVEGLVEPLEGRVHRASGVRIARMEQQVPQEREGTVLQLVLRGALAADRGASPERRARTSISRMGLSPDQPIATLSAGLVRRALLARALVDEPDLLLLDEPTNHLDIASISWLEEFLRRQVRTLLFVTHDRVFLRSLATSILDLDRGRLTRFDADYERYRERKEDDLDTETRAEALFDKRLAREESWVREGVRERRKRNQGRVGRLLAMREERSARRERTGTSRMTAEAAERSGRVVLSARGLSFAWPRGPVVEALDLTVLRGDRVGIIGPNGAGKTTLLRLLIGLVPPRAGTLRRGAGVEIAYFDQLHESIDLDASAADNIDGGRPSVRVGGRDRHVIGYLSDFLFTPDQARAPARLLSGGERNRLLLARVFARPSNLLVLDEPTNDLDLETLETLESLLSDYEGTLLLVSHDRDLLDHVVTSTLVLDGKGGAREFVGGYTDQVRQSRAGDADVRSEPARARAHTRPRPPPTLSRDERRELLELPSRIEIEEDARDRLHREMADPLFFRQPGEVLAAARSRLRQIELRIQRLYERWEALEAKRAGPEGPDGPGESPGAP